MNYTAMPQVARDPKGTISTWTPSAEEAFVKEEIRGAGYCGVNSLMRDSDGTWHARAYKGPRRRPGGGRPRRPHQPRRATERRKVSN